MELYNQETEEEIIRAFIYAQTLRLIFTLAFTFAATLAFSVELSVDYIDGYLDIQNGDEWDEVYVGDVITEEAVIKLDEDSIAEIYGPGIKLTLTKPGIYAVEDLIDASGEQRSVGLASVVGGKVASLFADKNTNTQAAVMGVRGAKSESSVQWMTGDTAELIGTGKERIEDGEFEEAFALFEEAYDFAEMDEETEVLFYLGYTSYLMGELRFAAEYLGDIIEVDTEAEFFPNLLLFYGQILAETFAFEEAIEWIQTYRDLDTLENSVKQTAYLIEGISYKSIDDAANAKSAFESSRDIDPESDVAKTANSLLGELD